MALKFLNNGYFAGKVGIGTDSPGAVLEVRASATSPFGALRLSTSSTKYWQFNTIYNNTDPDLFIAPNGGAATMTLQSTGNVGIGTTSPGEKLEVAGNIELNSGALIISGTPAGQGAQTRYISGAVTTNDLWLNVPTNGRYRFAVADSQKVEITADGNVGIGTTNPSAKLEVSAAATQNVDIAHFSNSNYVAKAKISLSSNSSGELSLIDGGNNTDVFITSNGNSYFNGGNVGIGTTSPGAKLHVDSASDFSVALSKRASTTSAIKFTLSDPSVTTNTWKIEHDDSENLQIFGYSTDNLLISTNSTERMRITSDGNVGIGTTSPSFPLHVNTSNDVVAYLKSSDNKASILLADDDTQAYLSVENGRLGFGRSNGVSTNNITILQSNNNVGIGTTSPTQKLHVDGNTLISAEKYYYTAGTGSGFGSDASGNFKIRQNDADLIFGSGNNVGIGTTNPGSKLTVSGSFSADTGLFSNELTLASSLRLQSNITILNKAQTSFISFATRNTSGSEAVMDLTNVGSINGGAAGPYLPLTGGTLSGNVKVDKGSAPGKTAYLSDDGLYIGRLSAYGGGYPSNIIVDPSSPNHLDINSRSRINLKLNNNTVLVANDSGNVGIGTTSPSNKLDVNGTASVTDLRVGSNASGEGIIRHSSTGGQGIGITTGALNSSGIGLYVSHGSNNRNVGIGTTSPSEKLDVNGNLLTRGGITSRDTYPSIFVDHSGTVMGGIRADATNKLELKTLTTAPLSFQVNSSEKMRITSSGNVGIGTTNPQQKLHVAGNGRFESTGTGLGGYVTVGNPHETAGNYSAYFFGNTIHDNIYMKGAIAYETLSITSGRGDMHFLQNSAPNGTNASISDSVMTIRNDGNVGIGTTSPTAKLQVSGKSFFTNDIFTLQNKGIFFNGLDDFSSGIAGIDSGTSVRIFAGGSEKVRVKSTGNVGIGTTTPGFKLDVTGEGNFTSYLNVNSSTGIRSAGWVHLQRFATDLNVSVGNNGTNVHFLVPNGDIQIKTSLLSNQENTDVDTGAEVVAQVAHATYTAAFFDFVVKKGTNVRSGTVYACHNGDTTPLVEFTETSTNDLGDTSDVTLSVDISGANMRLLATVISDDWSVKSLIRAI